MNKQQEVNYTKFIDDYISKVNRCGYVHIIQPRAKYEIYTPELQVSHPEGNYQQCTYYKRVAIEMQPKEHKARIVFYGDHHEPLPLIVISDVKYHWVTVVSNKYYRYDMCILHLNETGESIRITEHTLTCDGANAICIPPAELPNKKVSVPRVYETMHRAISNLLEPIDYYLRKFIRNIDWQCRDNIADLFIHHQCKPGILTKDSATSTPAILRFIGMYQSMMQTGNPLLNDEIISCSAGFTHRGDYYWNNISLLEGLFAMRTQRYDTSQFGIPPVTIENVDYLSMHYYWLLLQGTSQYLKSMKDNLTFDGRPTLSKYYER